MILIKIIKIKYKYLIKPILFRFESEKVHEWVSYIGRKTKSKGLFYKFIQIFLGKKFPENEKNVDGVKFQSLVGLAAGFDYNADLYHIIPAFGFGFTTIGTITNQGYEGNACPRLGRLPKSKALLVNKGFKNLGIDLILQELKDKEFEIPTGISIGKTNIKSINTKEKATKDIIEAFQKVINSGINFSYYELNISCPNLHGEFSFYEEVNLRFLLENIQRLNLSQPIYIKMPIELTNEKVLKLLKVISNFKISGVIFGNLQKNRNDSSINQDEIKKYKKGYPSGKPTSKRSTELIKLTKDNFDNRFTIIGCGGIFNYKDAKEKLEAGADLLQLITGLIYEGPQLVYEINYKLGKY
ncbi:MAG: quinone-dependent dihydroorotate dehydrogenase [Candidatus Paceibacterota bacterium]